MPGDTTEDLLTRWRGALALLASGPTGYGPHNIEALASATERLATERNDLLARLAESEARQAQIVAWLRGRLDPLWSLMQAPGASDASVAYWQGAREETIRTINAIERGDFAANGSPA